MVLQKKHKLLLVLAGIFLANALTSEIIGSKLFSLEKTLGLEDLDMTILGIPHLSFTLTAGVISWPLIFTITDIINDYYGMRVVKFISYLGVGMITFMFLLLYVAIKVVPSNAWVSSNQHNGIPNIQVAYSLVLGQGLNIIFASIVAFITGQLLDAYIFKKIKLLTGDKLIWLRALASTLISQLIDTVIVLLIAFHLLQAFPLRLVMAWIIMSYLYKFFAAIVFLPLVYIAHIGVEKYLGKDIALDMRKKALHSSLQDLEK